MRHRPADVFAPLLQRLVTLVGGASGPVSAALVEEAPVVYWETDSANHAALHRKERLLKDLPIRRADGFPSANEVNLAKVMA